jgi:hypothetical protein
LGAWSSPFSGYSLISNRRTPAHRDNSARPEWYDLLATFSSYTDGVLEFPGLGLTIDYPPGSLVALWEDYPACCPRGDRESGLHCSLHEG